MSDGTYGACTCDAMPDAAAADTPAPPPDGTLFVLEQSDSSLRVFPQSADGDIAPLRIIRGGNTGLAAPVSIDVDATHGEIFVANGDDDSITVYDIAASGNVAPVRRIAGASTGLMITSYVGSCVQPGIRVDPVNDELFVPCSAPDPSNTTVPYCVDVFARTANGDTAPIRRITAASPTFPDARYERGILVDTTNNELYVLASSGMMVYARTADGNATPVRTLTASTCAVDAQLDLANGELWVNAGSELDVYARTASGSVSPLRTFSNPGSGGSFALDLRRRTAIVAGSGTGVVSTLDMATGARLHVLQGTSTGLTNIGGMALMPAP
jgi:DNA-binding beta-propeller fold protein YncE